MQLIQQLVFVRRLLVELLTHRGGAVAGGWPRPLPLVRVVDGSTWPRTYMAFWVVVVNGVHVALGEHERVWKRVWNFDRRPLAGRSCVRTAGIGLRRLPGSRASCPIRCCRGLVTDRSARSARGLALPECAPRPRPSLLKLLVDLLAGGSFDFFLQATGRAWQEVETRRPGWSARDLLARSLRRRRRMCRLAVDARRAA